MNTTKEATSLRESATHAGAKCQVTRHGNFGSRTVRIKRRRGGGRCNRRQQTAGTVRTMSANSRNSKRSTCFRVFSCLQRRERSGRCANTRLLRRKMQGVCVLTVNVRNSVSNERAFSKCGSTPCGTFWISASQPQYPQILFPVKTPQIGTRTPLRGKERGRDLLCSGHLSPRISRTHWLQ